MNMTQNEDSVNCLIEQISKLERNIDDFIKDSEIKSLQIKKLYKENEMLKKKYHLILQKIEKYSAELDIIKKHYGKN